MYLVHKLMPGTNIYSTYRLSGGDFSCLLHAVDCGAPVAPRNGSLESYILTTEGSEVFDRCNPGLVPEGRMRAVCTRDGWSPNPADLNCTESVL